MTSTLKGFMERLIISLALTKELVNNKLRAGVCSEAVPHCRQGEAGERAFPEREVGEAGSMRGPKEQSSAA